MMLKSKIIFTTCK